MSTPPETPGQETPPHEPYIPPAEQPPELTFQAVLLGAVLGIIFGASSLYLVLKVGMTVSASVPIAVLSITLFRGLSKAFGLRPATILENNIVQTTGSAGESIAFGVGVTMPALLLLGFEMDVVRVMTVAVLGGLLGILMMIPLRRAFIVKQHGKLPYPEGTACAEVLVAGEKGGATARMVFLGFGIALLHKFLTAAGRLWTSEPAQHLYKTDEETGDKVGLKGAEISGELSPELLGVGYLIGPRIACLMMGGAALSYFVLGPLIANFGEGLTAPVLGGDQLIKDMSPGDIWADYLRYIGAGAVAAGGIISMTRSLPLIWGSIVSGLRDLRASRAAGATTKVRTERDLSMRVVLFGSLGLVLAMMLVPQLGLGVNVQGLLGALMILLFGFLFVTVSSRLTGEVGSSSNPISGMTIATVLLTCVIFFLVAPRDENGRIDAAYMLTALTVAAVVCIASSNGGTTSQDLKTGYLVGGTPRAQQLAILVGALTSALVIGGTMLALDAAATHYTEKNLPNRRLEIPKRAPTQQVGKPHQDDTAIYYVVHVRADEYEDVRPGRYLVDDQGTVKYRTDMAIAQESKTMDTGVEAPRGFTAPQPRLFSSLIEGILGGTLEWTLFIVGALIAVAMELAGVSALPFAVGMYIPLGATTPIFVGGMLRGATDLWRGRAASDVETETSPGVLLSSGYIAGGTLCGLLIAFLAFPPLEPVRTALDFSPMLGTPWADAEAVAAAPSSEAADTVRSGAWLGSWASKVAALCAFGVLAAVLVWVGLQRPPEEHETLDRPREPI